jgi:hypothetical protein
MNEELDTLGSGLIAYRKPDIIEGAVDLKEVRAWLGRDRIDAIQLPQGRMPVNFP